MVGVGFECMYIELSKSLTKQNQEIANNKTCNIIGFEKTMNKTFKNDHNLQERIQIHSI